MKYETNSETISIPLHNQAINEYIINSLPELIRFDKILESFARTMDLNPSRIDSAVIIRKKDLLCLISDGEVTNTILLDFYENIISNQAKFGIKSATGYHSYATIPLDNSKNPLGDKNKDSLFALARCGFKPKTQKLKM